MKWWIDKIDSFRFYSTFSLILTLLWLSVFLDGFNYDVANDSMDFFLAGNNFLQLLHWIWLFFFNLIFLKLKFVIL